MQRPDYIKKYLFNWEAFEVIIGGKSSIDGSGRYFSGIDEPEKIEKFIKGYGFNFSDPINKAELFGHFQEALQFIKRYFLKEGNPDMGIDLTIPNTFHTITDFSDLFMIANRKDKSAYSEEDSLWAGIILKLMHVILHADKDLRYNYFKTIQTQILDRFYRFVFRDNQGNLFLGKEKSDPNGIQLVSFDVKSEKERESTILKLLHKQESVAEDLFDRIGVRFVTKSKLDSLMVIKFFYENYIVMINNIKPSRSRNSLFDLGNFKSDFSKIFKSSYKDSLSEEEFVMQLEEKLLSNNSALIDKENKHTSHAYSAIHFTCRQLIRYQNPFYKEFVKLRKEARKQVGELADKILALDTGPLAKDIQFFYPYEVQVCDEESYQHMVQGEASHTDYKKSQLQSAIKRLFKSLIEYKNIQL